MKLLKFTITVYYKSHRKLRRKKKTLPDSIQKIFKKIFKKQSVASVKGIRLWNNLSQETKRPNMRKRECNVRPCPPPPLPFWCISRMHSACLDSCGIADEQIDNTQHVYMAWSWDIVKIFFPALLYLGFWKLLVLSEMLFQNCKLYLCSFLLLLKGSSVHSQAFFLCDEGGQVQREAVRVVQQPCCVTCVGTSQSFSVCRSVRVLLQNHNATLWASETHRCDHIPDIAAGQCDL